MNEFILFFEVIGVIAFAVSGALTGMRTQMDLFGTCVLGITTAVAGGMIRDTLLGLTPVSALLKPEFVIIATIVSLITFLPMVNKHINLNKQSFNKIFLIADSVGLGIFTALGFQVAYINGFQNWFLLIFVAVITGVGGGVCRDVLAREKPIIFIKHIYALASIIGAVVCYFVTLYLSMDDGFIACCIVVFIIRILSAHFNWRLPNQNFS